MVGTTLLIFICSALLWAASGFLLRVPLSKSVVILAVPTTGAWMWWVARRWFPGSSGRAMLITLTLSVAVCALLLLGSGRFYDLSSDGQTYHQRAVAALAGGWNAVYDESGTGDERIDHYVWGPWIHSAVIYLVTGRMEEAKAINGLMMLASFFIAVGTFLAVRHVKGWEAVALGTALTLNPVAITQSLSFMVDGQLAALIATIVCLAAYIAIGQDDSTNLMWIPLGASAVLLISTKLSAVAYFVVLFGGITLWFTVTRPRRFRVAAGTTAVAALLGIGVAGTPLVSNSVHHGTPFFPMIAAYDMNPQMPANFVGKSTGEKLITSLFSEAQLGTSPTKWKTPFTVSHQELDRFENGELRAGGFGPLFGGAILLAFTALVTGAVSEREPALPRRFILWLVVLVLVSTVVNPEAWWARFAPQLWLIPILGVLMCLLSFRPLTRILGYTLLAVIVANSLLIARVYFESQARYRREYVGQWETIIARRPEVAKVYFSNFYANQLRFDSLGLQYEAVPSAPRCTHPINLLKSETVVCMP